MVKQTWYYSRRVVIISAAAAIACVVALSIFLVSHGAAPQDNSSSKAQETVLNNCYSSSNRDEPSQPTAPPTVPLRPDTAQPRIRGIVITETKEPIADIVVTGTMNAAETAVATSVSATTTTLGLFELPLAKTGIVSLIVDSDSLISSPLSVHSSTPNRVTLLVTRKATIKGTIATSGGDLVPAAEVSVWCEGNKYTTKSSNVGTFSLTTCPGDVCRISVSAPGYPLYIDGEASTNNATIATVKPGEVLVRDIRLAASTVVRGVVRTTHGDACSGATVLVRSVFSSSHLSVTAQTNSSGEFVIKGLERGHYSLVVYSRQFEAVFSPQAPTDNIGVLELNGILCPWLSIEMANNTAVIVTQAMRTMTGRVVSQVGIALSNMHVFAIDRDRGLSYDSRTLLDGSFTLEVNPMGAYLITAVPADAVLCGIGEVIDRLRVDNKYDEATMRHTIQVKAPIDVYFNISDQQDVSVEAATIESIPVDTVLATARHVFALGQISPTLSGRKGDACVSLWPNLDYALRIYKPEFLAEQFDAVHDRFESNKQVNITLRKSLVRYLSFEVMSTDGQHIPFALINVGGVDRTQTQNIVSDSTGTAIVAITDDGDVGFLIKAPGFEDYEQAISPDTMPTDTIRVVLIPTRNVSGQVLLEGLDPVSNVIVAPIGTCAAKGVTNDDGHFYMHDVPQGKFEAFVTGAGIQRARIEFSDDSNGPFVVIVQKIIELDGVALWPNESPIAFVRLSAVVTRKDSSNSEVWRGYVATDSNGMFVIALPDTATDSNNLHVELSLPDGIARGQEMVRSVNVPIVSGQPLKCQFVAK